MSISAAKTSLRLARPSSVSVVTEAMCLRREVCADIEQDDGSSVCTRFYLDCQPGLSTIVGHFKKDARYYVAKILRTPEVEASSFGRLIGEPRLRKVLKRLPVRGNQLRSTVESFGKIREQIETCQEYLGKINPEIAEKAISTVCRARFSRDTRSFATLTRIMSLHSQEWNLFPPTWIAVRQITFEDQCFPGVIMTQEDFSCGTGQTASYCLPLRKMPWRAPVETELLFLVLLGRALQMALDTGLGLDLLPHPTRRLSYVRIPNVLITDSGIAYVDITGLFSSRGNSIEKTGFWLQYGNLGFARFLGRRVSSTLGKIVARQM